MTIIDTHTHLYAEAFDIDRKEVIQNAINQGVEKFFVPAIDSNYTQKMLDLELAFPDHIYLMAGLHPCYVKENYAEELQKVADQLQSRKFFGVGEIGIDLFWDKTFLDQQKVAFKTQIQWAKEYKLPINIHCRDAFDAVFEVLESERASDLFGIFHCFTGNYQQALQAISLNLKLGIGGVVTFKNGKIDQFLNQIDPIHIVLETDSPYLAPNPYRGKRNESQYLCHVIDKLAQIYGLSTAEIAKITTQNAQNVFQI